MSNPALRNALLHRCPACGKGCMYSALLTVADVCSVCGFALKEHDAGDGPAFFAMFIIAILVTGMAFALDMLYPIPLWAHMVLWVPVVIAMSVYLLKVMKSWLIGAQYQYDILNFQDKSSKEEKRDA